MDSLHPMPQAGTLISMYHDGMLLSNDCYHCEKLQQQVCGVAFTESPMKFSFTSGTLTLKVDFGISHGDITHEWDLSDYWNSFYC